MPSSVSRSMSMRGHSAMVAILAITGRFNLRMTGRAVMFLIVKKARDIATPAFRLLTGALFSVANVNLNSVPLYREHRTFSVRIVMSACANGQHHLHQTF